MSDTKTIGTFCSGIATAELAFSQHGFKPIWFSEVDPFCNELLAQRFPSVPNLGDMTKVNPDETEIPTPDVIFAGTPCQSFSVAGLRGGLADARGNLAIRFVELIDRIRPRRMGWENVPGVLSSWTDETVRPPTEASIALVEEAENARRILEESGIDAGPEISTRDFEEADQTNDFDQFTFALVQRGYSLAWGILDAQYFGVAQRRNRVFLVGSLGKWTDSAAILFDRESLSGNPAPSRETGQGIAASLARGAESSGNGGYARRRREDDTNIIGFQNTGQGWWNESETAQTLRDSSLGGASHANIVASTGERSHCLNGGGMGRNDYESETMIVAPTLPARKTAGDGMGTDFDCDGGLVTHALSSEGADASEDGSGRGTPIIAFDTTQITSKTNRSIPQYGDACHTLAKGANPPAVAFGWNKSESQTMSVGEIMNPVQESPTSNPAVQSSTGVRRLTPTECEKLQAIPPDYTAINRKGKIAADGPRYRAIGNAMCVNVVAWIAKRMNEVDELSKR